MYLTIPQTHGPAAASATSLATETTLHVDRDTILIIPQPEHRPSWPVRCWRKLFKRSKPMTCCGRPKCNGLCQKHCPSPPQSPRCGHHGCGITCLAFENKIVCGPTQDLCIRESPSIWTTAKNQPVMDVPSCLPLLASMRIAINPEIDTLGRNSLVVDFRLSLHQSAWQGRADGCVTEATAWQGRPSRPDRLGLSSSQSFV